MQHQTIAVLDYGSQYSQLICRRVREKQVYAELISWDRADELLPRLNPAGIILSGGPNSVYETGAPTLPAGVIDAGVPVLGICYGLQLLAHTLGGQVSPSTEREYGSATVDVRGRQAGADNPLFADLPGSLQVWMSHGDRVERLPDGFLAIAHSANSPLAAIADESRRLYGIQFHPEVVHTPQGGQVLENFVKRICGCVGDWTAGQLHPGDGGTHPRSGRRRRPCHLRTERRRRQLGGGRTGLSGHRRPAGLRLCRPRPHAQGRV